MGIGVFYGRTADRTLLTRTGVLVHHPAAGGATIDRRRQAVSLVSELGHVDPYSCPIWNRAKRRIFSPAPAALTMSRIVFESSRTHGWSTSVTSL